MASQLAGFAYRPMRQIGKPKDEPQEQTARPAIDRLAVEAVKAKPPATKAKKPKKAAAK